VGLSLKLTIQLMPNLSYINHNKAYVKRLELFEFEDYEWLPKVIRNGITNLLMVLHRMAGTSDVIVKLIEEMREKSKFNQLVDMGSGSGGPMFEVIKKLNSKSEDDKFDLVLSDYYPNVQTVEKINTQKIANVSYLADSLDATDLSEAPEGLKTMIASFHHMNPQKAKGILKSAEKNRQPILIYEIAKNNVPTLLWWILLPISLVILILMSLVMTLFVRPFTFKQLFFTYLIPIIPIIYAWDGQASMMRTYTFDDIEKLLGEERSIDYVWSVGDAKKSNGKNFGYYIMGYPKH
jgi:hypothetical protein